MLKIPDLACLAPNDALDTGPVLHRDAVWTLIPDKLEDEEGRGLSQTIFVRYSSPQGLMIDEIDDLFDRN
jgi:hypothetical protein